MTGKGLQEIFVAVIESHRATRSAWQVIIDGTAGLRCVGTHANPGQALRSVESTRPHVVVIGASIAGPLAADCIRRLRRTLPSAQFIVAGKFTRPGLVVDMLKAGATSCVTSNGSLNHLTTAIETVARGGAWFSPDCARSLATFFHQLPHASSKPPAVLTRREADVILLARTGLGHKQIAARLGLSYDTIRTHFRNIYKKLRCSSRSEAVAKYYGF